MFTTYQNTPTGGDCCCGYAVVLDKEYTVGEFIKEVLTKKEHGYIGIYDGESIFGDPKCEYSNGKIHEGIIPEEILSKVVIKVLGSGGWSRMDYLITIA